MYRRYNLWSGYKSFPCLIVFSGREFAGELCAALPRHFCLISVTLSYLLRSCFMINGLPFLSLSLSLSLPFSLSSFFFLTLGGRTIRKSAVNSSISERYSQQSEDTGTCEVDYCRHSRGTWKSIPNYRPRHTTHELLWESPCFPFTGLAITCMCLFVFYVKLVWLRCYPSLIKPMNKFFLLILY